MFLKLCHNPIYFLSLMNMKRREFIRLSAVSAAAAPFMGLESSCTRRQEDKPEVGKPWTGWKEGHLQVHFIYTGVAESAFYIFPDGTTMLLDCGDHNAIGRGDLAVPVLPHPGKHSGEWIARYVERVNPAGTDVDYMMLSHYHSDHAGCLDFYASKDGEYSYSGFSQAAQKLRFGKAFDRLWPDYDDPLPFPEDYDSGVARHMKQFYTRMTSEFGMKVERFKVGETGQVAMLHKPDKFKDFTVRNICGNGRICGEDGIVRDLYADRIAKEHPSFLNENGMSLGMIISYGPFKLFTAGDFSDEWKLEDGSVFRIEDALADICGKVNVAKINHHGHYSMPEKLVRVLSAQVYVSCVWDQLHNVRPVMERLSDRSVYPGDRVICPGIFPAERRAQDDGQPWLADIVPASFDGVHVVLDVQPGGKEYSITCLGASDESMTVRKVLEFKV